VDVLARQEARRGGQLLDELRSTDRSIVSGERLEPGVRLLRFPSEEAPLQPADEVADQQYTDGENGHGCKDSRRIEHAFRLRDQIADASRRSEILWAGSTGVL
jgi:hypothetical protein